MLNTASTIFLTALVAFSALGGEVPAVRIDPETHRLPSAKAGFAGPDAFRDLLARYDRDPASVSTSEIDRAANQHGAIWSRLYWYTNLEEAQVAARAEGKPILYLRMMGKLTDEYSCANSRFFRTVLYANANVSRLLREKFVLVWESERPVPVITVDYGDGRVLKRTITGNSIHYVLNADGRIVDALPGLYDPVAFARIVSEAGEAARTRTENGIRLYLSDTAAALSAARAADLQSTRSERNDARRFIPGKTTAANTKAPGEGDGSIESPLLPFAQPVKANGAPAAEMAMSRAMSKSGVERPLVAATAPVRARDAMATTATKRVVENPLLNATDFDIAGANGSAYDQTTWERMAAIHKADASLDSRSIELIRSQNPGMSDSSLGATIAAFETSLAIDTVRNNYEFRPVVLQWLMQTSQLVTPREMNERVYGELFLTPRSDPWLGLAPENTYTALTNEGCLVATRP